MSFPAIVMYIVALLHQQHQNKFLLTCYNVVINIYDNNSVYFCIYTTKTYISHTHMHTPTQVTSFMVIVNGNIVMWSMALLLHQQQETKFILTWNIPFLKILHKMCIFISWISDKTHTQTTGTHWYFVLVTIANKNHFRQQTIQACFLALGKFCTTTNIKWFYLFIAILLYPKCSNKLLRFGKRNSQNSGEQLRSSQLTIRYSITVKLI